ncbi:hypothetical protein FisN_4Hh268 [Fistulifera solaris]|uniref:Phytanoyl-CoA dioxygenase n=1 Tax=Fistulifera solaris TaxID=1519565 RepID=A0A1Z5KEF9_FISSO|nr:hypothetical protein FisN_4Hh268 [Fistulifera solaris]|eukprot:GAX24710.1 hypothetical protein FisN_4Hh268 [Fistulifera solaris]
MIVDKLFEVLSEEQIATFLNQGILVVPNVLSQEEVTEALSGLYETLASHGVEAHNLEETGKHLQQLSSTGGSGGVLDLFYAEWKFKISTNSKLFHLTSQLWKAAYCYQGETKEQLHTEQFKWHPYGAFNPTQGYAYIDRVGYRIPTRLAERLGTISKKNKHIPIQRSLTPHLDCCPENPFPMNSKWRPIQCFVSLTDNTEPNTGGFEAAPGFHREFATWAAHRPPTLVTRKGGETLALPAPCVGEYTHIRPREDAAVLQRVQHIPVTAGSAVLWDNRIPHANAYRHDGTEPRVVVYTSFLPDVAINRQYARQQLEHIRRGRNPPSSGGLWMNPSETTESDVKQSNSSILSEDKLTELQRRLLAIDD